MKYKELRKLLNYHPSQPREYVVANIKKYTNGKMTSTIVLSEKCSRHMYQKLKRGAPSA